LLYQIVWDPVRNSYINKDEEAEDDEANTDAPPSTDAELRQKMLDASVAPNAPRRFNRPRTRGMHLIYSLFTYRMV